jgi:hypothetical protein
MKLAIGRWVILWKMASKHARAGHVDRPLDDSVEEGEPTHGPRMKLAMWMIPLMRVSRRIGDEAGHAVVLASTWQNAEVSRPRSEDSKMRHGQWHARDKTIRTFDHLVPSGIALLRCPVNREE